LSLALLKVSAHVAGLEYCAVQGHGLDASADQPPLLRPEGHLVEHAVDLAGLDQILEGTPQDAAIGRADEADLGPPVGAVFPQGFSSQMTLFLMLAQDSAGEQLGQGEALRLNLLL
jgi:hypothetical protein